MYSPVEPVTNFAQQEQKTAQFWREHKTFEKSVQNRAQENSYVFYDGPPFISGLPHYGHLLCSIAKDVIPRYQTMKGKRVERVWGWDAHGLTVEGKVQQKLGIKNRRDIEKFGLEQFTQECYKYTSETSAEWPWYIERIGRWVDMENAYKTIDQKYMESVIWVFKQVYDKGLIYQGVRTSMYCPTCGTPVSNFEVAMDNTYKDVEDPAVTIKFKVTSEGELKDAFLLAWTTTPWTLPSNKALVVDAKEEYVVVEHLGAKYVLAQKRYDSMFLDKSDAKVVLTKKGAELVGLTYEPLFTFFSSNPEKDYKVYEFEGMVTTEEGTGIVHSAPGFGAIDTEMGYHYGIEIMLKLDDEGKFVAGDAKENPYEKMYYSDANPLIMQNLHQRELVFKEETVVHRFPYHDRCDTLLIQKAQNSWFVNVKAIREKLLEYNENINWVPDNIKYGRFKMGIEQAPDWCISRSRFWATPMPVWQAEDGEIHVIGSIAELQDLSGQEVTDLHRPYIDKITFEKNGKKFTRIPEVLDSWFEAGSMPYAQFHYPFENKQKFEANFPGDYIVEYVSQTRAWFYVMHVLTTIVSDTNSFKNAISTGTLLGNDGRKMSKTYGNFDDPKDVMETIGGDAQRLYFMASPLMIGEGTNFDITEIKNKSKKVLSPLWNTLRYFVTYANSHNFNAEQKVESTHLLDLWIKARLSQTIQTIDESLAGYYTVPATKAVEEFVDDLSRWYVRRSRDRISGGDNEALSTLCEVLYTFSKAVAPIIPFITEEIFQVLKGNNGAESVHLELFPTWNELTDTQKIILEQMKAVRDICTVGNSIRMTSQISVKQPLQTIYVMGGSSFEVNGDALLDLIKDELNVKNVEFVAEMPNSVEKLSEVSNAGSITGALDLTITEPLRLEGVARELVRTIQELRKEKGLNVGDKVEVTYEGTEDNVKAVELFRDEIMRKVGAISLTQANTTALN
jgi:isoleucyl-tRNA synthetase